MSLFSGMKLVADSSCDQSTGDKARLDEADVMVRETPVSTETGNKSNILAIDDSSSFTFIPGTRDGRSTSSDIKHTDCFNACTLHNSSVVSDKLLSSTDNAPSVLEKPTSSSDVSLDDLNFDLDPIKVSVDRKEGRVGHHPTGFDLQDLDFSHQPSDHNAVTESAKLLEREICAVKSESGFSFIAKDPRLDSDEDAVPVDGPTLLDVRPLPAQEISEREPVNEEGKGDGKETTDQGEARPSLLERLQVYKSESTEQLHAIKKSTFEVSGEVRQLAKDCVASGRELLEKQHQLQELQQQQQQAVDVEDYDKAEELQYQFQGLEDAMHSTDTLLPCSHPNLGALVIDLQSLSNQEKACRQNTAQTYRELIAEQKQTVADSRGRRSQLENGHLRSIQEERSKLDRDFRHLQLDNEHLQTREAQLMNQIDERTVDLRHTRDSLIADRTLVQEEIEILEAKLLALHHRETAISELIAKKDQEIEEVSRDFDGERLAVEKERGMLKGSEVELTRKGEGLDDEERKLAGEVEEIGTIEASQSRFLADLEDELAREEVAITELEDGEVGALSKLCQEENTVTPSESSANLLKTKARVGQMRDDIKRATSSLLQTQTKVVALRQKVSDTEGHIAALNETKQLAVSGRNFAEAKRLTEEIKQLTAEGRRIQGEMEELSKTNGEQSEAVRKLRQDVDRMQQEVDDEEKRLELSTKDKLLEHITECKEWVYTTPQSPLFLAIQRAELTSSSLQVKFLCLKHQLQPPAELDDFLAKGEGASDHLNAAGEEDESRRDGLLEELRMEVEKSEAQLQEAVEQEDYDAAELLQKNIDRIRQEMKRCGTGR